MKVEEIKLAFESNIKFSLVDDIDTEIKNYNDFKSNVDSMSKKTSDAINSFNNSYKLLSQLELEYNNNRKQFSSINGNLDKLFSKISLQAKDLGVSVNELPVYNKYVDTKKTLNTEYSKIQDNWNKVFNYKK